MYRDESETLHEADRSHNFAAAFVRNLRCSAVPFFLPPCARLALNVLYDSVSWVGLRA